MKSKNIQMRINPELYAQFKRVDGESNNERMAKLLADSREKYRLIDYNKELIDSTRARSKQYCELLGLLTKERCKSKILEVLLGVSIAVSVCSVAYVCVVNGWFL